MGTTQSKDYIIATDDTITVLVCRREVTRYQDLISTLLHHFPTINEHSIIVQTNDSGPPQKMTIYVTTLTGEKVPVMLWSASVFDIAEMMHDCKGIPVLHQYFYYQGKWLLSDCKLSSYNIHEGAILHHVEWAMEKQTLLYEVDWIRNLAEYF
ncbi:hypothetical protein EDD18DRAFT_1190290 [Armillaria luteobubalina]|uniref:Ubiquitin-like domain-containing protein n=1 Tax=Armillaria luteobubalina TaxID=153913 RepID=A0AA39UQC2_9AGAR|nr:hypothetical protein EDD18DRAFT_1190290 [Armillaria luteobubalina]